MHQIHIENNHCLLSTPMEKQTSILVDYMTVRTSGRDAQETCENLSKDLDAVSSWTEDWNMEISANNS